VCRPGWERAVTESERLAAHQKEREVLFASETLVITVLQALTGGAMFAAIAGAQNLVEILGERQYLIFLTTVDVALLAAVLSAWGKHQYKKWDVKAAASASLGNLPEAKKDACLANFYVAAMRWSMGTAVTAVAISLIELPAFAWLMTRSVE